MYSTNSLSAAACSRFTSRATRGDRRRQRTLKPLAESMEARALLAVLTVASPASLSTSPTLKTGSGAVVGSPDTPGITATLRSSNLELYINNASGFFTSDFLARVDGAINAWDALLSPYNVKISEVSNPSAANLVLTSGGASANGGAANGILGSYNPNASPAQITILQGWNWYTGANPAQIGASQFDFQTTITHELGHALGLGGSNSPTSPLNETLHAGVVLRFVTALDLDNPYQLDGPDPQTAAAVNVPTATNQQVVPIAQQTLSITLSAAAFVNNVSHASSHTFASFTTFTPGLVASTADTGPSLVFQSLLSRGLPAQGGLVDSSIKRIHSSRLDGEISLERAEAEFRSVFNSPALQARPPRKVAPAPRREEPAALREKHDAILEVIDTALRGLWSRHELGFGASEFADSSSASTLPLILVPDLATPAIPIETAEESGSSAEETYGFAGLVWVVGILGTTAGLWRTGASRTKRLSFPSGFFKLGDRGQ